MTIAISPSISFASPSNLNGPMSTLGKVSTRQTIHSATVNPASGEYVVGKSWRWSYFSNIGLGYNIGEINKLENQIDVLSLELDRLENKVATINEFVTFAEVMDVQNQFNDFLLNIGQQEILYMNVQSQIPFFPFAVRNKKLNGVLTFNAKLGAEAGAYFVDSPLEIVPPNPFVGETDFKLQTDTVLDLSSALIETYSIAYSHDLKKSLLKKNKYSHLINRNDRLMVGMQLNYYRATLSTQLVAIDQEYENEELSDMIDSEYDHNQVKSAAPGLDIGVLWISEDYKLGATWKNVNEPRFKSTNLAANCLNASNSKIIHNCELAERLEATGQIDPSPEYVMENQISVEAGINSFDKQWVFSLGYDVNQIADLSKNPYQWMSISASYYSDNFWIPRARVGFRSNLVGSELDFANIGFTFLGGTHIDFSMSLDSTNVDNEKIPKAASLNIGFEKRF